MTHYKLPYDTEVDKDIHDWISKFHRTKKGEMVRHAIRYYMAILEEGETIKFPPNGIAPVAKPFIEETIDEPVKKKRVKPIINPEALK